MNSIREIMSTQVTTVSPQTPLTRAVEILLHNDYNGLPVVDSDGTLRGILTDHDLIVRGSNIHLPTFLKLLENIEVFRRDSERINPDIRRIISMKVHDVMNPEPFTLPESASIIDVIDAFSRHHRINPIPVVDASDRVVGVVSRYDVIKLYSAPNVHLKINPGDRELDENVRRFIKDFGNNFVFVSRVRTRLWLMWALAFAAVGFAISFLLILRIEF